MSNITNRLIGNFFRYEDENQDLKKTKREDLNYLESDPINNDPINNQTREPLALVSVKIPEINQSIPSNTAAVNIPIVAPNAELERPVNNDSIEQKASQSKLATGELARSFFKENSLPIINTALIRLEEGASPNYQNPETGDAFLHSTIKKIRDDKSLQKAIQLIGLLLAFGADVGLENKDGKTPVDLLREKKLSLLEENKLIKKKCIIYINRLNHFLSEYTENKYNEFHFFALFNCAQQAGALLCNDSTREEKVIAKDALGKTPIDLAEEEKSTKTMQEFLRNHNKNCNKN